MCQQGTLIFTAVLVIVGIATGHSCENKEFKCLDGSRCIPKKIFCDGNADCGDGSDEIHPNNETINGTACRRDSFICKLPTDQVLKSKWLCRKSLSCHNDNEFKCLDGSRCIQKDQFCNIKADCRDGSDEIHPNDKSVDGIACRGDWKICKLPSDQILKSKWLCTKNLLCDDNEFQCLDGSGCLEESWFCDEYKDCRDGSDEIHMNSQSVNGIVCHKEWFVCKLPADQVLKSKWLCPKNLDCDDNTFKCLDSSVCIQGSWFCNGVVDCLDGSDEIHPNNKSVSGAACRRHSKICKLPTDQMLKSKQLCAKNQNCNNNEFKCLDDSRCISNSEFCNGHADCPDRSDEIHPSNESVKGTVCRQDSYICKLPTNQMRKKKLLCPKTPSCDDSEFKCLNDSRCIRDSWFCDGGADCRDGSDEIRMNNEHFSGIACRVKSRICKLPRERMIKSKWLCE